MPESAKKLAVMLEKYFNSCVQKSSFDNITNPKDICVFEFQQYEEYRMRIVNYQLRNNISSVYWATVIWKEEIFRYPVICSELEPFSRDWQICARSKEKLTNKFLNFCSIWNLPIVEELDLHEKEEQNYVKSSRVLEIAARYKWCYLLPGNEYYIKRPQLGKYTKSYQIIFTNLTNHNAHEDDEDCISFSGLQMITI